jgi:hypothetical protein
VLSDDECAILTRIAVAFERMADHFAPAQKERKPAVLGSAAYSEEERERLQLKSELTRKTRKI